MNRTIGDIQDAIESYARPESDDEHEHEHAELGIGQDARAKLVEQARLANEKRERDETGFVYSDESEDEEEDFGKGLPLVTKSRTSIASIGTESQDVNGFHDEPVETLPAEPKAIEPALIPAPIVATSTAAATVATPAATPKPEPELTPLVPTSSDQREPSVGTLQPAFIPATPPLVQTPTTLGATTPTPLAQNAAAPPSSTSNRSSSIPAKPPTSWTVDDVVSWAQAKGFDDSICDKFRGKCLNL